MSSSLDQKVKRWVLDDLQSVSTCSSVSIHIDELLGRDMKKAETIVVSIRAFIALVEQMRTLQMPAKPILVIPLEATSTMIELNTPRSVEAMEDQLAFEPPSLCLEDWGSSKHFAVCEEYKSPLAFDLMDIGIPIDDHNVYVYYREHRYAMGIENEWEFARAVYVEYYPDSPCSN